MMTMMVISYIVAWVNMLYAYLSAKSDVELWEEQVV